MVKKNKRVARIFLLILIVSPFFLTTQMAYPQSFRIISPNGGQDWKINDNHYITWQSIGLSANTKVRLELFKGERKIGIIASNLTIGPAGTAGWNWRVGQYQGGAAQPGSAYKIRIVTMDGRYPDQSDGVFRISRDIQSQQLPSQALQAKPKPSVVVKPTIQDPQVKPGFNPDEVPDFSFEHVSYDRFQKRLKILVRNQGANYQGPIEVFAQCKRGTFKLERTITRHFQNFPHNFTDYFVVEFDWDLYCCYLVSLLKIDPQNKIAESNKGNNTFQGNIFQTDQTCFMFDPRNGVQIAVKLGGKEHGVASGGSIEIGASDVSYDPMLRIAYIDLSYRVSNCCSQSVSTAITYKYYTHPDNNVFSITDPSFNYQPGQNRYIQRRIAMKIRQGNFLRIDLGKTCQAWPGLIGDGYFQANFIFKNDFEFY